MSQVPYINPYSFYPPNPRPNNNIQTDTFLAYMQDGKIFRQTPEGPQAIGVVNKTHEDLQADYDNLYSTCDEYYKKLVELRVIVPEPTQEEILRRQAEQIQQQAEQLANASKVIADSAASQRELMNMVAGLREELASLKCANGNVNNDSHEINVNEGGYIESNTEHFEQVSNAASVAGQDQSGVGDNAGLPKFPSRPVQGTSRAQGQSSKRAPVSSKRNGGRNT